MEPIMQYEVVWVNLDPTIGSEMQKTSPCVVLSPNEMNKYLQTIVIAPITSNTKPYPTRIEIKHKKIKGWVVLDQIRTIDRSRITQRLENLSSKEKQAIKQVIHEMFVA